MELNEKDKEFDYVSEIWKVAEYCRDTIKTSDYNKVILPFALLRRLECALEDTRKDVVDALKKHEAEWGKENSNYCRYSKKAFYNVTSFKLNNLGGTNTLDSLVDYIDGFSPNAREIFEKFKMKETAKQLSDANLLYWVCTKFGGFDLSPETVSDREMANIYEHLIQKFGESIAENAEDFLTPRDICRLAVSMLLANEDDILNSDKGDVRTIYDCCGGTNGFISDALDMLEEMHSGKNMKAAARIVPYSQEVEPESWAMGKAAMLLRNVSNSDKDLYDSMTDLSQYCAMGDTLADDKFPDTTFDWQCTNPPYGKDWSKSAEDVLTEAKMGIKGRFYAGLPSKNDGSMLFLQHVISHMKPKAEGGGKAAIVLSASPLFTGDAGSGPSNIRRWIFQNDLIDCIVKIPAGVFFRTSINTYLWILSNNKPKNREGLVQLIDASDMKTPLRKNLGKKNVELSPEQISEITRIYVDGEVNERSVIVPYSDFEFRQVTTQQPLRMGFILSDKSEELNANGTFLKLSAGNQKIFIDEINKANQENETRKYHWCEQFAKDVRKFMDKPKPSANNIIKILTEVYGDVSEKWDIVRDKNGNIVPDNNKTDKENIPVTESFDTYMAREVLPFAPETYIDEAVKDEGNLGDGKVGVLGTNISFNKYFYHYEEPRKPEEIAKEIENLESELNTFMRGIFDE